MADRKGRSVTFKLPYKMNAGLLKTSIEQDVSSSITVFQDLGNNEYLIELDSKEGADALIDEGFDFEDVHVGVHPPHGCFTNVSILGLRSYVEDEMVVESLSQYGEIKSDVIRLKYKADHDLSGIENGNRLVKMVITAKSIPYSIRIGGEWCRIIHNNQHPVCNECNEVGHTKKRCPQIECRICKQKGHMSYVCSQKDKQISHEVSTEDASGSVNEKVLDDPKTDEKVSVTDADPKTNEKVSVTEVDPKTNEKVSVTEVDLKTSKNLVDEREIEMDIQEEHGLKRSCPAESDSDTKVPSRRSKYNPVPNLEVARQRDKSNVKKQSAS